MLLSACAFGVRMFLSCYRPGGQRRRPQTEEMRTTGESSVEPVWCMFFLAYGAHTQQHIACKFHLSGRNGEAQFFLGMLRGLAFRLRRIFLRGVFARSIGKYTHEGWIPMLRPLAWGANVGAVGWCKKASERPSFIQRLVPSYGKQSPWNF